MIHFDRVPEPPTFDEKTRKRGKKWLDKHPGESPRDYWSPFKFDLADGFRQLCGYSAMLDPAGGTVDHYISCAENRDLAY
jgi:hypothetical protein